MHTITLQYALALCNAIKKICTSIKTSDNEALWALVNAKYGDAERRMRDLLNSVLVAGCNAKSSYSSLVCNRIFVEKLNGFVANDNQMKYAQTKEMLFLNKQKLNCFLLGDINNLFDFIE